MSLYDIYDAHKEQQDKAREEAERLKDRAQAATCKVADGVLDAVNSGVTEVYVNQKLLDNEARELQAQALRFSKQTKQWVALCEQLNNSLKEIGDIENWARVMEDDVVAISTTLEAIHAPPPKLP